MSDWLRADGFEPVRRSDPRAATEELQTRPFDLLIADEMFVFRHQLHQLSRARKPMMPTMVVGDGSAADRTESRSRHILYLARPLEKSLFLCTLAMAMVDGRPVRCSVRKPVRGFSAIVNGMPSSILDISNEGVRLELHDRRSVPLPYFNIMIPLVGVAVTVQRMWTMPVSADRAASLLCGGALVRNQSKTEQAWRAVVETITVGGAVSAHS
jgi:hypothetical protein